MQRVVSANTTWSVAEHPTWNRFEALHEKGFTVKIFLLMTGGNPEHIYLCTYYSACLTIRRLRGLAPKVSKRRYNNK